MPDITGKLTTCDRCGQELFRKYIGKGEIDGGFTTWDKYEELPDTWLYEHQIGYLCPRCACMFRTFIDMFMCGKPIAPVWRLRPEDVSAFDDILIMLNVHKDMEARDE